MLVPRFMVINLLIMVLSILSYTDLTLTTERVVELFAAMDDRHVDDMGVYLDTPSSKMRYTYLSGPAQRKETYLDYYVHNHPVASWTKIAKLLHRYGLHKQAAVVENTYIQGMPLLLYLYKKSSVALSVQ